MRTLISILLAATLLPVHAVTVVVGQPAATAAPNNGLLNGLQAYYRLEEGSGNATDASGNSRTLTETGSNTGTTGKIGTARTGFNSTANYLSRASEAAYIFGSSGPGTITCWINLNDNTRDQFILSKGEESGSDYGYGFFYDGTGTPALSFLYSTSGTAFATPVSVVTTPAEGSWWFLVMRRDVTANLIKFSATPASASLVNSDQTATLSGATAISDTGKDFVVGLDFVSGSPFGSFVFDGIIDELGVWNVALSDAQVAALFNAGSGLPFSSFNAGAISEPSYLVRQNFEGSGGTGYDNGESWTEAGAGTIDQDSTASISGSQSLAISGTAQSGSTFVVHTGTDTVEHAFLFHRVSSTGNPTICTVRSGTTGIGTVSITTGTLGVQATGGTINLSSDTFPTGSTVRIWIRYVRGSGADATLSAGWSDTGIKPTFTATAARSCVSANGTSTAQPNRLYIGTTASSTFSFIYDEVRTDDVAIGSNPL